MSYTVPYSFTPGTKARAQEVNANFNVLTDYFNNLDSAKADINLSNITEEGINVIKNNATIRNIGEIIMSPLPLSDSGLHLLDGTLINNEGIYKDFVKYIIKLYNDDASANFFTTENLWQNSVSTYGVCGKFVYDSTNNTVRLPKITGKIDGTTDLNALGDLEPLFVRLPNITGSFNNALGMIVNQPINGTGAFANGGYSQSTSRSATGDNYWQSVNTVSFSASRSSSVYSGNGSNTDIHEQAVKMFIYIVIANSTKTDIQVDIDEVATDLNGKADTDLSNINASQSAKSEIVSWGMPDYSAGISVSWATQYNAPANGYIYATANSQSAYAYISINGTSFRLVCSNGGHVNMASLFMEVSQGDAIKGTGGDNTQSITFFPMKGAN